MKTKRIPLVGLVMLAATLAVQPVLAQKTITVWTPQESWKQSLTYYTDHMDEFKKKHPDVEVKFVLIPYEGHDAKFLTAFAGVKAAPDIFMGKPAYYGGSIGVADPAPDDLQQLWSEKLVEVTAPFFKVDGEWIAYPVSSDLGMMIYYNADHYREVGLDPDKPPKTFDELLEHAKKLAQRDADGKITRNGLALRYSGAPIGLADKALPFIHAYGGRMYGPDGDKATGYLDSDQTKAALRYMHDLIYKHKVSSLDLGKPVETFAAGKSSIIFREGWLVGWMKGNAPDLDYRVAALPEGPAGYPRLSLLFSWAWMVFNKGPNQDIAWDWIRSVSNVEDDLALAKLEGYQPVWKEAFEDPFVSERPDYEAVKVILGNPAGPSYDHPNINEIATKAGEAVQAVLFGEDPDEVLDRYAKSTDRLMRRR